MYGHQCGMAPTIGCFKTSIRVQKENIRTSSYVHFLKCILILELHPLLTSTLCICYDVYHILLQNFMYIILSICILEVLIVTNRSTRADALEASELR